MVDKKKDEQQPPEVAEQLQNVTIVTQIATAIQNLMHRVSALEIDAKKSAANEQLMDKQISFLGDRIDFIRDKYKPV